MERLTRFSAGGETIFRLSVPDDRADALARHLESLLELMALDASPVVRNDLPEMPPGMLLKHLRTEKGMTQKALAALIGATQSRVSDMEQGVRPIPPEAAVTLGRTFGVPTGRFLL